MRKRQRSFLGGVYWAFAPTVIFETFNLIIYGIILIKGCSTQNHREMKNKEMEETYLFVQNNQGNR